MDQTKSIIMKKLRIITLGFLVFLLTSCIQENQNEYQVGRFELRQLVKTTDTTSSAHGAFFLVAGTYSSSEEIETKIKMYALVNDTYKYLEYDIRDVRIKIDDTVKTPYLTISYTYRNQVSVEEITSKPVWLYNSVIVLTTPGIYLPENLLPIKIN